MFSITANELKRNGVAGIERVMLDNNETGVMVDVRGKAKYVILSVDEFNQYREYQLDQAIVEAETCLAKNEFSVIGDLDNYAQLLEKEIFNDI
jgi:histidinol phosphatase-like PHP family hydrolase